MAWRGMRRVVARVVQGEGRADAGRAATVWRVRPCSVRRARARAHGRPGAARASVLGMRAAWAKHTVVGCAAACAGRRGRARRAGSGRRFGAGATGKGASLAGSGERERGRGGRKEGGRERKEKGKREKGRERKWEKGKRNRGKENGREGKEKEGGGERWCAPAATATAVGHAWRAAAGGGARGRRRERKKERGKRRGGIRGGRSRRVALDGTRIEFGCRVVQERLWGLGFRV